jgi:hypothetical protein
MYKLVIITRRPGSIPEVEISPVPEVEEFTMAEAQIVPLSSPVIPICNCPVKNDEELVTKAISITPVYKSVIKVQGQTYLRNNNSDSSLEEVYVDIA